MFFKESGISLEGRVSYRCSAVRIPFVNVKVNIINMAAAESRDPDVDDARSKDSEAVV